MSDADDRLQKAVEAQQPLYVVQVVVTKDGRVAVQGPIENEYLTLQILADGMHAVRQHASQQRAQRVVVPKIVPPNGLS